MINNYQHCFSKNYKIISLGEDPNLVIEDNNEIYRIILKNNENKRWFGLDYFIKSDLFSHLKNNGFIINNEIIYEDEKIIILHIENIENFSHPDTWTKNQKKELIIKLMDINIFLKKNNSSFLLTDCHLYNSTLNYNNFKMIDFGSFSCDKDLIKSNIFNLCVRDNLNYFDDNELNDELLEIKHNISTSKTEQEIVNLLNDLIIEEKQDIWDEYDKTKMPCCKEEIIPKNNEELKILEFILKINPKKILDLGSNSGIYSRLFANNNINVIALDKSANATNKNHKIAKNLNLKITSLCFDINDNFENFINNKKWNNIISWNDMLSCDLIFASSIAHHLYKNKMDFKKQVLFFNSIKCEKILIEFIKPTDEHLKNWNLSEDYSMDNFIKAFDNWTLKDAFNFEENRIWFFFTKKN